MTDLKIPTGLQGVFRRLLLAFVLGLPAAVAEVSVNRIERRESGVELQWQGGSGPYRVEASRDLRAWSDQGDLVTGTGVSLAAFGGGAFYRVSDLDPGDVAGDLFGRLDTDQGEFGALLGRHRLKSRVWLYKTRGAPHTGGSVTPANYWRKLIVFWQYFDDGGVRTWSGPLESLGTVATPGNSKTMTVTWTQGTGAALRTFRLSLEFPYAVNTARTSVPNASDPYYELKCDYASPQPEWVWDGTGPAVGTTSTDTTRWIELAPLGPDWKGVERRYSVSRNGARVEVHFLEGMPLYQGEPPWILKTYSLDRWLSPTSGSGSLPGWSTDSFFSRTLLPGHHNFVAEVLIDPALDPAISAEMLAELRNRNIRYIYTFKDLAGVTAGGADAEDIRYIGFDNTVRRP